MTSRVHGSVHALKVGCSFSLQKTPLKTPCIANLSLPPLSAHVPVNTSFRQTSPDNLCCVHPHVVLNLNTVYTEFSLSGRDILNQSPIPHDVIDLSSIFHDVVDLSFRTKQSRWLKTHSLATIHANFSSANNQSASFMCISR